ncbi:MAG: hypothetical protein PHC62_01815 [Candidatus Izemoplasmatales bacterium]|nr:hypothetical protein [Candidatus Izemoplasmatales bacterium]
MLNKANIIKIIGLAIIEVLLSILLFIVIVLSIGYIGNNLYLFTDLSVLQYGTGTGKFLMAVYLLSNIGFMVILSLIFIEIGLFTLRTMLIQFLKALEFIQNKKNTKTITLIKSISLISIFKAVKINTPKRSIIAYFSLLIIILGSGFIAKSILKAYDVQLYRVYETINLYHEITNVDFTTQIENGDTYNVFIETRSGNVHVYQVQDQSNVEFAYYYDTQEQLDTFTYNINEDTKTITIIFNPDITSYEEYIDPLIPSMELYLPDTLLIGNLTVNIIETGDFAMEYVNLDTLNLTANQGDISIIANKNIIQNYHLEIHDSKVRVNASSSDHVWLLLDNSDGTFQFGTVNYSVDIYMENASDLYLYNSVVVNFTIDSSNSNLELREVYTQNADITTNNDILYHKNGVQSRQPVSYIVHNTNSDIKISGVNYDFETN